MYDFPLVETLEKISSFNELSKQSTFQKLLPESATLVLNKVSVETKHILSHQKIYATFWHITAYKTKHLEADFTKIDSSSINNYPLPKLIENYVKT